MKKTILLSAMAVATALSISAKTADELRIYINPGHGSWTPDDRPATLVNHPDAYKRVGTDTLSFFESNTDLEKGFGVLERLIEYGLHFDRTKNQTGELWEIGAARDLEQNIVMSRVKNGPYHDDNGTSNQLGSNAPFDIVYYNRNLTEICEEVQVNNFDMFISIHSNAATEGTSTNYPLFLYRGYDSPKEETGVTLQHQQTSRAMSDACWSYAIGNPHAVWTAYSAANKNLRGDINFYGSNSTATRSDGTKAKGYLGALKHSSPGFLVEGYFHTYQPARHRAMNWDVCRVEGNAYARGIADYFGLTKESFGTIYGIVRDKHEKFSHAAYSPNPLSDDIYLPLNGATVVLKKDGQTVATKTTDGYYNGAFVFDGVEPGTYTIEVTHPDYVADPEENTIEVVVKAAQDTYPKLSLTSLTYEPPKETFETYPDPAATIKGISPANEYNFTTEYADVEIAQLEGKIVRRTLIDRGMMYILAIDILPEYAQVPERKPVPTILVYDLAKKEVLAELSTEGAYGSIQDIADIQMTGDHYLLGICQTKNQYSADYIDALPDGTKEPRGTIYIYKWANDEETGLPTGTPNQWLSTQLSGRWFRSYGGAAFAYDGTTEDGKAIIPQPTITAPYYTLRSTSISVVSNEQAGNADYLTPNNKCVIDGGTNPGIGENFRMFTAPYDTEKVIYLGPDNTYEYEFLPGDNASPSADGNEVFAGMPGAVSMFKYAGASYLVAPTMEEGQNVGVRLVDISANIANATEVTTANTSLEGVEVTSIATAGEVGTSYDDINEVYTDAWLNLYVLRDNKITKLTTHNVAQPVYKAGMAYNLESTINEYGDMVVSYSISEDGESAQLVLTAVVPSEDETSMPEAGEEKAYTIDATAGEHTFTVPAADLDEETQYNYRIEVTSKMSPSAGELFAVDNGFSGESGIRGGVLPFVDPRYPTFGYTLVVNGKNQGLDLYNQKGELVKSQMWKNHDVWQKNTTNVSNPVRATEREGKAVLASFGDGACGITYVDVFSDDDPVKVYQGTKQSGGEYIYEGVNIGGNISDLCFVGEGENTVLYTYSEDHDGQNGSGPTEYEIARYEIGNNWTITERPTFLAFTKALLASHSSIDLFTYGNGFFYCQNRGVGGNIGANPGFGYIDCSGDEEEPVYGSHVLNNVNSSGMGFAISTDGKTIAHHQHSMTIDIYDVEWNGNVPELTYAYTIPTNDFETTKQPYYQMRFDAAGNLHTYQQFGNGYHVYGLKGQHVSTTQASTNVALSGIDKVSKVETKSEGPAVYYNLNGVRVNADTMVPGVYVKVVDGNATKVIVK